MILIIEAAIVGFLILIIGTIVSFFISRFTVTELPPVCKDWNKNHIMEISLFLTGFFTHIVCEFIGLNKWYCKNGSACIKK